MLTSTAECFRTRQALHDLQHVVASAPAKAVKRLSEGSLAGATTGSEHPVVQFLSDGTLRFKLPDDDDIYSTLLLAAVLPDHDFGAFVLATASLLADRLQQGDGRDDLFWNWDAFNQHYRLADPTDRAALLNAFRHADTIQSVKLGTVWSGADCTTQNASAVLEALYHADDPIADHLSTAIERGANIPGLTAHWQQFGHQTCRDAKSAILGGFRWLYEYDETFLSDWKCPQDVALIPVL